MMMTPYPNLAYPTLTQATRPGYGSVGYGTRTSVIPTTPQTFPQPAKRPLVATTPQAPPNFAQPNAPTQPPEPPVSALPPTSPATPPTPAPSTPTEAKPLPGASSLSLGRGVAKTLGGPTALERAKQGLSKLGERASALSTRMWERMKPTEPELTESYSAFRLPDGTRLDLGSGGLF